MKKVFITTFLVLAFAFQTTLAQQHSYLPEKTSVSEAQTSTIQDERRLKTEPFIRTELYFGRNSPSGEVSEEAFADFTAVIITREFPDGLTLLDGIGQFKDSNGNIIREKTKVLILFYHFATRRTSSRKIELIRDEYKKRFEQQSVLRVDDPLPVRVSF
jgi:hypothetical protein